MLVSLRLNKLFFLWFFLLLLSQFQVFYWVDLGLEKYPFLSWRKIMLTGKITVNCTFLSSKTSSIHMYLEMFEAGMRVFILCIFKAMPRYYPQYFVIFNKYTPLTQTPSFQSRFNYFIIHSVQIPQNFG